MHTGSLYQTIDGGHKWKKDHRNLFEYTNDVHRGLETTDHSGSVDDRSMIGGGGNASMQRAIIYTRVSTEEQTLGYSLDSQRDKCLAKAKELGVDDTLVFEEAGVSGEVANRPALMDAIAALRRDPTIKYFICTDPDRLSRQLAYLLLFTEQIEKHARLIFTDFRRDNTAEGELFYSIRGAIAQFEKEMIKRRTVSGKIRKARERKWTHWPDIYGYTYKDGEVFVNDEEANIVRMIFQLGANHGVSTIKERLELMGIPSPRAKNQTWSKTTIRRILLNEAYYTGRTFIRRYDAAGTHLNRYRVAEEKIRRKIRPREEWVEMRIPTIITEEEFRAAQRRLQVARRRYDGQPVTKYLLSGLLRCGTCGKTWHGHSTARTGKRASYYVCTFKSPGPPKSSGLNRCPTHFVQVQVLDEAVWSTVLAWITDDEAIERFHTERRSRKEASDVQPEIELLKQRQESLNQEENALIERLAKETNPRLRQKIGERLDNIAEQLDQVQKLLEELTSAVDEPAPTIDREAVEEFRQRFPKPAELTFDQRYEVIHRLIREIVVHQENQDIRLEIIPFS